MALSEPNQPNTKPPKSGQYQQDPRRAITETPNQKEISGTTENCGGQKQRPSQSET
jgi:hypothetical protein